MTMVLKQKLDTAQKIKERLDAREEVFSTGSLSLNLAIGKKDRKTGDFGVPSRTIMEVFGHNQTGKTLLAESLARSVLGRDPTYEVIWIASEEPNLDRMVANGLDLSRVLLWTFIQDPEITAKHPGSYVTAEDGLDLVLDYIREGVRVEKDKSGNIIDVKVVKLVVVDTLKALVSLKDTNDGAAVRDMADKDMPAIRAKLIEKFLIKWAVMNNADAILIMLNQTSEAIGPDFMIGALFKQKTCGGRYKEFMSYLRIRCESLKIEAEKDNVFMGTKPSLGFEFFYTIIKNKYAEFTSNRRTRAVFLFDPPGFVEHEELVNMATFLDIIKTGGGGYYTLPSDYKDEKLDKDKEGNTKIQGIENLKDYVSATPKFSKMIRTAVIARRKELFAAQKGDKPTARKALKNENSATNISIPTSS